MTGLKLPARLLVGAPCRLYVYISAYGGAVPWAVLAGIASAGGTVGLVWALVSALQGGSAGDGFWSGVIGGLLLTAAVSVYSTIVVAIVALSGRRPASVAKEARKAK